MSEPVVAYPIRDVLGRMEGKIDNLATQMREFEVQGSVTARNALAEVHALELRVQALELAMASSTAVRAALAAALASPAVAAVIAWLISR